MNPQFEHDCKACKFLGTFEGADLYYCPSTGSCIARYSSDMADYASMPYFVAGMCSGPVAEAARRATEQAILSN